ncbi:polycomb group RING finger protein 6 [Patella vulgata]|uniref:polycomb group RING finger protein 6 n=1 Tax=Patella vulgata TaxID=6465 RepID=UPI00217FB369|nr:polycomb group RING finger protein 6 [Patella vulgata]XP_050398029.1 polycomb group RING finger protein 6 [Patella vulgata]
MEETNRINVKQKLNSSVDEDPESKNNVLVPIANINCYLTCGICKGYLYEASTITDCMHTFCKSCIVKFTEKNVHCPTCNIVIHPTEPLINIKLDRTLQDILYSLLPHVAQEEQEREKKFYEIHGIEKKYVPAYITPCIKPTIKHDVEHKFDVKPEVIPPVSLLLNYGGCSSGIILKALEKRYLRVTGGATICHVVQFLRKKLTLKDYHQVNLYCSCGSSNICLDGTRTLQAVKDLYSSTKDILELEYHVLSTCVM